MDSPYLSWSPLGTDWLWETPSSQCDISFFLMLEEEVYHQAQFAALLVAYHL